DESEPGTFKDRVLMEEDPFSVIEALTIAGFACGVEKGYIYIRGEYPEATHRLQNAIEQACTRGLLGENILGKGTSFEIEIRPGVYEVPHGATLGALLEMAGGVRGGRTLQAILLGGAAGVFVRPEELEIPLTLEGARSANATLGSGVIMVFDDTVDMKAILLR